MKKLSEFNKPGIEKYLLLNKKCLQSDNSTFTKKVKILGRELEAQVNSLIGKSNIRELIEAQKQTDKYIEVLVSLLAMKHPEAPETSFKELGDLLKEMTRAKVGEGENTRTKSLESIIPRFNEIITSLKSSK